MEVVDTIEMSAISGGDYGWLSWGAVGFAAGYFVHSFAAATIYQYERYNIVLQPAS